MSTPLIVSNSIVIKAPAATVWDLLVNPQQTKKYMFGCETVSDWQPGSELLWRGEYEGKEMVFVKGHTVDIIPGQFLSYTTIDPNNPAVADAPENYLTVTYALEEKEGETVLTATQGDYANVAEGQKRYEDTVQGGGWQPILEQVKKLAEGE